MLEDIILLVLMIFPITEVSIPTDASNGDMDFVIVRLTAALPAFSSTTTNYTILAQGANISTINYTLPSAVSVSTGAYYWNTRIQRQLPVIWNRSTKRIGGSNVTLSRLINQQGDLATFDSSRGLSSNGTSSISRVNFKYELAGAATTLLDPSYRIKRHKYFRPYMYYWNNYNLYSYRY